MADEDVVVTDPNAAPSKPPTSEETGYSKVPAPAPETGHEGEKEKAGNGKTKAEDKARKH